MINETLKNLILAKTNFTEITSENIIIALSVIGWNLTVYKDSSIFINKEKIQLSESDLSFMRGGIDAYNLNHKHRFAENLSF